MSLDRGVAYFVIGAHYLRHATNSLNSLRRFHPGMHATLFCNDVIKRGPFDEVVRYESVNDQYPDNEIFLDRIRCLSQSPCKQTLFLDADTYVDGSLDELFRLLGGFDIAARQSDVGASTLLDEVPLSFPEYSAGVLLWRWSPVTRRLFADWEEEMVRLIHEYASFPGSLRGHGAHSDQVPLRRVLWHSSARLAALQDNYLCQVGAGGLLRGRAIILHGCRGRPGMLAKVAALINAGQSHEGFGTFRFHTGRGSVVPLASGRGLLADDGWAKKRRRLLRA